MNTFKQYFGKFLLLPLIFLVSFLFAESLPVLDVWSGREQSLPVPEGSSWALVAEHGRELFSGISQGVVQVNLPALTAGSQLSVHLVINGQKSAKVRIWSPEIFAGLAVKFAEPESRLASELLKQGLKQYDEAEIRIVEGAECDDKAAITLCFPNKHDFPLSICDDWQEISLHRTKKGACLSVLYSKGEQLVDCRGNLGYIRLKKEKQSCYLFSPDFDFQSIDNILLLKAILEEKKP